MADDIVSRYISTPWAAALINDPNWTPAETASRSPKASGEDAFFAETLGTNRTIRSLLTLRPTKEAEDDFAYKQLVSIVDLGPGVNGYPDIAHGGFVATLLDEICGVLIVLNLERKVQRSKELGQDAVAMNYFTAYLNTTYKRPVPTPGMLLCTAKIERQEADDKKLYVRATVEDGNGTIYTTGKAMFVRSKERLTAKL